MMASVAERGGAGERIAAEGRAMAAGLEEGGRGSGGEAGADRHAVGEPLGERDHVGPDRRMLEREPGAGAAGAALHFVEHEQPLLRIADFAQTLEITGAAHIDAAFALDQLDQHGDHVAVALGDALHRFEVVERHPHETGDQRLEAGLHLAAAGGGERGDGAAVKRLFQHHDGRRLDFFLVAVVDARA